MERRVAHCHLLAEVLSADGMMGEDERALLEEEMQRLELTDAERDQVRHFEGADGAAASFRERSEDDRQEMIDALVNAVLIDGKLSPTESAVVKKIAGQMGI
jgi:uncharacterized tellurite resistance protein B-like protein